MVYINFPQYVDWGGKADAVQFDRLSFRAERLIDRYTQSRIRRMEEVPESVGRCMVELVNAMVNSNPTDTASTAPLSAFSNDGYSETYSQPLTKDALDTALYGIICEYLAEERDDFGTPLLYFGVR